MQRFKLLKPCLILSIYYFLSVGLFAQTQDLDKPQDKPKIQEPIPSWIGDFKKLDAKELAGKREGWYATGLPLIGNDAVSGKGGG